MCACDCGNITYATSTQLKTGNKKSCGCSHIDAAKKAAKASADKRRGVILNDLTGMQFGELTVIELDYEKIEESRNVISKRSGTGSRTYWKCKCSCGSIVSIDYGNLVYGNSESCGCIKSKGELKIAKLLSDNNIKFEKQKWFNNCRFPDTNWVAYFDFYVQDYNLLIEYDGDQHFYSKNSGWNNEELFKRTQGKDAFKNKWCKENDIPLIRIPYTHYDDLVIEDLIQIENNLYLVK